MGDAASGSAVRGDGLDIRGAAPIPRLYPRDQQSGAAPVQRLCRRCDPARSDVAHLHRSNGACSLMTPSARLSAAVEVLADIDTRHRPAADALRDWGLSHRFAGSSDRAAISGIVYDALRRKSSTACMMGETTPRANVLGMLKLERGLDGVAIARLFDGSRFAPEPMTEAEERALGG